MMQVAPQHPPAWVGGPRGLPPPQPQFGMSQLPPSAAATAASVSSGYESSSAAITASSGEIQSQYEAARRGCGACRRDGRQAAPAASGARSSAVTRSFSAAAGSSTGGSGAGRPRPAQTRLRATPESEVLSGVSARGSTRSGGSSTAWDLKSEFMRVNREGPTEAPGHIQTEHPAFAAAKPSPFSIYYFDESAPNTALLGNDVRGEHPLHRAKKSLKNTFSCKNAPEGRGHDGSAARGAGGARVYPIDADVYSHSADPRELQRAMRAALASGEDEGSTADYTFSGEYTEEGASAGAPAGAAYGLPPATGGSLTGPAGAAAGHPPPASQASVSPSQLAEIREQQRQTLERAAAKKGSRRWCNRGAPSVDATTAPPPAGQPQPILFGRRSSAGGGAGAGAGGGAGGTAGGDFAPGDFAPGGFAPGGSAPGVTRSQSSFPPGAGGPSRRGIPGAVSVVGGVAAGPRPGGARTVYNASPPGAAGAPPAWVPAGAGAAARAAGGVRDIRPRSAGELYAAAAVGGPRDSVQPTAASRRPGSGQTCPTCRGTGVVFAGGAGGGAGARPPRARRCFCAEGRDARSRAATAGAASSVIGVEYEPYGEGEAARDATRGAAGAGGEAGGFRGSAAGVSAAGASAARASAAGAPAAVAPAANGGFRGSAASAAGGSAFSSSGPDSAASVRPPPRAQFCDRVCGGGGKSQYSAGDGRARDADEDDFPDSYSRTASTASSCSCSECLAEGERLDAEEAAAIAAARAAGGGPRGYAETGKRESERDYGYFVRKLYFNVDDAGGAAGGAAAGGAGGDPVAGASYAQLPTYSVSYKHYPDICYDAVVPTNYADFFRQRNPPMRV